MLTFWKISGISLYFFFLFFLALLCTWHASVFTQLLCKYTFFCIYYVGRFSPLFTIYHFALKSICCMEDVWIFYVWKKLHKKINCMILFFIFYLRCTCTWHYCWTSCLRMKLREWTEHFFYHNLPDLLIRLSFLD